MKPVKLVGDVEPAEGQRRRGPAAGGVVDRRAALGLVLAPGGDAGADDLRVERAGQPAVAGDEQQPDRLDLLVLGQDRQPRDVAGGLRRLAGHPPDRVRVRAQRLDPLLGAAQPRGGDHLHRAGDLLDVLDRRDAVANVALRGAMAGPGFS